MAVLRVVALASAVLFSSACATIDPRDDFEQVARTVAERSGEKISWRELDADGEDDGLVRELLDKDLDERSAVRVALARSPRLQALYEELGIGRADVARASRLPNPILDAEVRFPEGGGRSALELSLVEDFVSVVTLPLARGRAESALESTRLAVTREVLATIGLVRSLFRDWQAAEQIVELQSNVLDTLTAASELAQRIHAAGNLRALDLANERVQAEEARLALAAAQSEAAVARARVDGALGLWGEEARWRGVARLSDPEHEPVSLERAENRAIESSLDLALERTSMEAAARTLGIAESLRFLADGQIGIAAERESEDGEWGVGPALSIPLPLFDGGAARVLAGRAALRQRGSLYAAAAIEIRAEVRAFAAKLQNAQARAQHLRSVVLPLRRQVVEETQLQYNAMQVGAFELLQARRAEIESGIDWIESVRNYWHSRDALELLWSGVRPAMEAQIPSSMADRMTGAGAAERTKGDDR